MKYCDNHSENRIIPVFFFIFINFVATFRFARNARIIDCILIIFLTLISYNLQINMSIIFEEITYTFVLYLDKYSSL